ncbi:hypothetical protein V1478_018370 [Vespula squamosa]|uniref:Uncharacterized protein n=1 Tax=Vespula squamosa TaxID=30214 RepID=A0ABD1ZX90_VESSQ
MSEDSTEKDIKRLEGRKLIPRLTGEGFNRVSRLSKGVVDEAKAQGIGGNRRSGGGGGVNEEGGWGSIDANPEAEASATDSIKCDVDRQVKMEREGSLRHPKIKSILCSRQSLSGIEGIRIGVGVRNDREKSFESSIKIVNVDEKNEKQTVLYLDRRIDSGSKTIQLADNFKFILD